LLRKLILDLILRTVSVNEGSTSEIIEGS